MQVGDLVIHGSSSSRGDNPVGIITHIWVDGGGAIVLFEDREYDVFMADLEVINESR